LPGYSLNAASGSVALTLTNEATGIEAQVTATVEQPSA